MSNENFETTHWSKVMAGCGDDARAKVALTGLCRTYYAPIRTFIRAYVAGNQASYGGRDELDLTHDFFAEILEKGIGTPNQAQGKFRSWLLVMAKHFLTRTRTYEGAIKRGGEAKVISIADAEEPLDEKSFPSDASFDSEWARTTVAIVTERVLFEFGFPSEAAGLLKGSLLSSKEREKVKSKLHLTETALKVAVTRLRKRFRILLRNHVAATLPDPSDSAAVDEELRYLLTALTQTPSSGGGDV